MSEIRLKTARNKLKTREIGHKFQNDLKKRSELDVPNEQPFVTSSISAAC